MPRNSDNIILPGVTSIGTPTDRNKVTPEMREAYEQVLREKEKILAEIQEVQEELRIGSINNEKLLKEEQRAQEKYDREQPTGKLNKKSIQIVNNAKPLTKNPAKVHPVAMTMMEEKNKDTLSPRSSLTIGRKLSPVRTKPKSPMRTPADNGKTPTSNNARSGPKPIPPKIISRRSDSEEFFPQVRAAFNYPRTPPPTPRTSGAGKTYYDNNNNNNNNNNGNNYNYNNTAIDRNAYAKVVEEVEELSDTSLSVQHDLHMEIAAMHLAIQKRCCLAAGFILLLIVLYIFY